VLICTPGRKLSEVEQIETIKPDGLPVALTESEAESNL
jgi:hypothetical protein